MLGPLDKARQQRQAMIGFTIALTGAVAFGTWMNSVSAGVFTWCFLMILERQVQFE